jgi:hypothetical protein
VRQVRWHAEDKDLVSKAVVLKTLVEVALIAAYNEQPVPPYLARLYMRVQVF